MSGGLGGVNPVGTVAGKVANAVVRGALASAITQGIGVATGLQDRFDWGGVAFAGVSAGVGSALEGSKLAGSFGKTTGSRIFTGAAAGLAASAAESLVTGRNFGDTVIANLPGIIANTIGNLVADAVAGDG